MKVDQDYLKAVLNAFLDGERSFVWPQDILDAVGSDMDDRFLFHMQILEDQRFVECLDRTRGLGYEIHLGGQFEWRSHPLRLTAAGHEFAEALNREDVWTVLKSEFKEASVETLYRVGRSLLEAYAKKQIGKYLDL